MKPSLQDLLAGSRFFPWKSFSRILWMQALLICLAVFASAVAARALFKRQFLIQAENRLRDSLFVLANTQPDDAASLGGWCPAVGSGLAFRFEVQSLSGLPLCASRAATVEGDGSSRWVREQRESLAPGEFRVFGDAKQVEAVLRSARHPDRILTARASVKELSATLQIIDASFGLSLLITLAAVGFFAVWSARRLVFPLGRLLLKTKAVLAQQPVPVSKEDLQLEASDEWSELESNIDDIRRDLAAKAQSLSREQLELETIMGAISDAIIAVDPDGSPLFFNSRFELLFGRGILQGASPRIWGIFRDPELLDAFQAALKEGRASGTQIVALEVAEAQRRFFSLSVAPLRREGSIYGAVGVFHDVTELKSAEQMRIDFVANVSHELRTPLTVIKGYADTLIQEFQGSTHPALEYATSISRNSDRLMNLMNDLLDLSSIESSDAIQKDPIDTEDLSERILGQLKGAFEAKTQEVVTQVEAPTVHGDVQRVEQVLVNLLGNANKYTPTGGKIVIRWARSGEDTVLSVKDSGPGIPPEHHNRLFERFYRVDKARSREQGGTGLGLAIVKHIMLLHGGSVWVESRPGEGATFYCRFPGSAAHRG
jgi:two-component system phosphate regulon sensor histidine kinase PhoR